MTLWVRVEPLSKVKGFNYVGIFFTSDGSMEQRWINGMGPRPPYVDVASADHGEEKVKLNGKAPYLLVCLCSNPSLWL